MAEPLLAALDELGARGFARLLAEDPDREGAARLLLDAAQAVLQRGEGYQPRATAAFQEVVSDLYEGFLADEKRAGVKPPGRGAVPPLVRWGSADAGPYTWPVTSTRPFGITAPLVSLPAANATGGLLGWAALAHETAGHDLLEADAGLLPQLAGSVRASLLASGTAPVLAGYWAERIDETAADVMGVLNMGPAAAAGLIGYLRGLNDAWGGGAGLRTEGSASDPHPTDLARAYLMAETVRLLHFEGAGRWADRLIAGGRPRPRPHHPGRRGGDARRRPGGGRRGGAGHRDDAAGRAGGARARRPAGLDRPGRGGGGGTAAAARRRRRRVRRPYVAGAYAAHAVAAGVYEAVSGRTSPSLVQRRMVDLLAAMHAANPKDRVPGPPPHLAAAPWPPEARRAG